MFQFKVDVSPESAKKHGEITRNLTTILVGNNQYLSEKLDLYLDDELVESLYISADLKGQESTSFVIEGPGSGKTKDEAVNDALTSMKKMQTILVTGSLPVKLSIAKVDVISPLLGKEFFKYTIMALFSAIVATSCMIFFRYKKIKISISIMIICLSEILITIGIAALIKQNLDLAAIAGIIVAVGTGSNDQIVITDEVLAGEREGSAYGWAEKLKRAFFIIMTCYLTIIAAMIPLWAMGAGLLKGFAIVTIIGVSIGVFITRPAFAKIIEILLK
jgi:preprotein translocase subunit SecD